MRETLSFLIRVPLVIKKTDRIYMKGVRVERFLLFEIFTETVRFILGVFLRSLRHPSVPKRDAEKQLI